MRAFGTQKANPSGPKLRLLAVSNGHGEDAVAAAVLQALKKHAQERNGALETKALPVVGKGGAYVRAGVALRGPLEPMPSGGFLKWDPKLWMEDLQAGLAGLTMKQMASIDAWKDEAPGTKGEYDVVEGTGTDPGMNWEGKEHKQAILAVGDVVPLFMAAAAGGDTPSPSWDVPNRSSTSDYRTGASTTILLRCPLGSCRPRAPTCRTSERS
eukprot:jgi/Pico_ML_1/54618/g510.t1